MFNEIEQQADFLQKEFWAIVSEKWKIDSSQDRNERWRSIWKQILNETAKEAGFSNDFFSISAITPSPTALESMLALSLMTIAQAEHAAVHEDSDSLDLLVIASETLGIIRALSMLAIEEAECKAAEILANKRHKENRELKSFAINYWKENIDPKLSAAKAADLLIGVVNLSHKKLAEVIAAERNKTNSLVRRADT